MNAKSYPCGHKKYREPAPIRAHSIMWDGRTFHWQFGNATRYVTMITLWNANIQESDIARAICNPNITINLLEGSKA